MTVTVTVTVTVTRFGMGPQLRKLRRPASCLTVRLIVPLSVSRSKPTPSKPSATYDPVVTQSLYRNFLWFVKPGPGVLVSCMCSFLCAGVECITPYVLFLLSSCSRMPVLFVHLSQCTHSNVPPLYSLLIHCTAVCLFVRSSF